MPLKTPTRTGAARGYAPLLLALLTLATAACADTDADRAPADAGSPTDGATPPAPGATADARPESRTDTVRIEGMAEPLRLTLFRAPDAFPLPFSAYVPAAFAPAVETDRESGQDDAAVRFVSELGGRRNPDAFVHVFVFPPGTDRNAAIASVHGYKASRGIPVSRGLEPIADEERPGRMPWSIEAYAFEYQSRGEWFSGSIGVGEHDGRFFQIVRHYPAEYGEGFPPRADLITDTWRWADGTTLGEPAGAR